MLHLKVQVSVASKAYKTIQSKKTTLQEDGFNLYYGTKFFLTLVPDRFLIQDRSII